MRLMNSVTNNNLDIHDRDGHRFHDNKSIDNFCNNYFIYIGTSMARNITIPKNKCCMKFSNDKSIIVQPVLENVIIKYIQPLKNNDAPGIGDITFSIIKRTHRYIVEVLVHVINLIVSTGEIYFKNSVVTPLLKWNVKKDIDNYRPNSLINNSIKILEKVLETTAAHVMQCISCVP